MQNTDPNTTVANAEPIQGETPDPNEVFFSEFGDELFKKTLPNLNDTLRLLLTTSIALMGGGIVFLGPDLCNANFRIASLLMFFVSVCISLIGVHPYRGTVRLGMPYEIKQYIMDSIWWKEGFIWACSIFMGLGLLLAFIGVLIGK